MSRADLPQARRRLFHPGLVSSGATLLITAFVTDVLYWRSTLFEWNNFSGWLLGGGLLLAALAALALVVDLVRKQIGAVSWLRFAVLFVATVVAIVNAFVHTRDAYTAVVPQGLTLSAITTILLLVVGLGGGWSLESRRAAATSSIPVTRS